MRDIDVGSVRLTVVSLNLPALIESKDYCYKNPTAIPSTAAFYMGLGNARFSQLSPIMSVALFVSADPKRVLPHPH